MIPIIDMHCDTILEIRDKRKKLISNDLHIDLERMNEAGYMAQNFALFTFLGKWTIPELMEKRTEESATPLENALSLSDVLDREMEENPDMVKYALSADDIENNFKNGYMSAVKTIEEGGVYEGKTENLKMFYDKGVRMTTLTWNFENELAYPNSFDKVTGKTSPDMRKLKPAGWDIVEACGELGIIIDVSHLNDGGILDILNNLDRSLPIAASHSNARSLAAHCRNLTDEMLKKLADRGGITGINFCADFLNERHDNRATIEDIVRHIKYIRNVAGIDAIGFGTDFDGIGNELETEGCRGMQKIAGALEKEGFRPEEIEKIFYKNALRVYREVLGRKHV